METTQNTPTPTNRVKITHLVIGLFFLGFVALATGLDSGALHWSSARYLWPALLVTVGVIGLSASYAANRRRSAKRPTG